MHHFSSFNNQWYRKSIEYMQDVSRHASRRSGAPAATITPCSSTAASIGRSRSRSTRRKRRPGSAARRATRSRTSRSTMGQGDFTIEYPPLHDLAASENPLLRVRARPADLHRSAAAPRDVPEAVPSRADGGVLLVAATRSTSTCRSTTTAGSAASTTTTTGRRRGVSGEGARSFYYPPKSQKCADCHMPLGRVERPGGEERHGAVAPLRRREHGAAVREPRSRAARRRRRTSCATAQSRWTCSASCARGAAPRDAKPSRGRRRRRAAAREHVRGRRGVDELRRAAGVLRAAGRSRSRRSTRSTPPSAAASRFASKSWCARARSATSSPAAPSTRSTSGSSSRRSTNSGRDALHSGAVADDGKGPVEPGAHFYRSLLLDEHGNPINKRNAWAARSVAYVRLIPPGAADTIHYRLRHPRRTAGDESR